MAAGWIEKSVSLDNLSSSRIYEHNFTPTQSRLGHRTHHSHKPCSSTEVTHQYAKAPHRQTTSRPHRSFPKHIPCCGHSSSHKHLKENLPTDRHVPPAAVPSWNHTLKRNRNQLTDTPDDTSFRTTHSDIATHTLTVHQAQISLKLAIDDDLEFLISGLCLPNAKITGLHHHHHAA